jgi:hypothetical protein
MNCIICNKKITGLGNNARPLRNGICCDVCNLTVVQYRIDLIKHEQIKTFNKNKKVYII